MELHHSFEISHGLEDVWSAMSDLDFVASCLPGANIELSEGNTHRGSFRVKLGSIETRFRGQADFETDAEGPQRELRLLGRGSSKQGRAQVGIHGRLDGNEEWTRVELETDVQLTGAIAQLGQGMADSVTAQILDQFVDNLTTALGARRPAGASGTETSVGASPSVHSRLERADKQGFASEQRTDSVPGTGGDVFDLGKTTVAAIGMAPLKLAGAFIVGFLLGRCSGRSRGGV